MRRECSGDSHVDDLRGEHGELKGVGNDCPVTPDSLCQLIDVSVAALVQPPLPHNAVGDGLQKWRLHLYFFFIVSYDNAFSLPDSPDRQIFLKVPVPAPP